MLIWFIFLLYPAPLLMLAVLLHRRVSLLIMLFTQALLLIGPLVRLLLGSAAFSGFENSAIILAICAFVGLLIGWPMTELLRRYVDRRRDTITSMIILPQAFRSTLFATVMTTFLNLCWQQLPLGWPIYNKLIGNWFGIIPTLVILIICLMIGLIGLPKYIRSVLYQR